MREPFDFDDRPRRKTPTGVPAGLWLVAGAVGVGAVCAAILIGVAFRPGNEPPRPAAEVDLTAANAAEFVDRTDRFKGKTIRLKARPLTPADPPAGVTYKEWAAGGLRAWAGRDVEFLGQEGGTAVGVVAAVPPDLADLPRAGSADEVVVRLVCGDGRLRSGNRVVSVDRAR